MQTERTINKILNERLNILPNLQQKIQQLHHLNFLWQKHVDKILLGHSYVANFRNQCLIVEVTSPAWATRLRYLTPKLLKCLQQEAVFAHLQTIDWYIRPTSLGTNAQSKRPSITLSPNNALIINEAANNITNEKLKKSLQHLAKNVTKY